MKYQDCAETLQGVDDETAVAAKLADANINPRTGLATDYLNHFNEAIMLLDMLSSMPECIEDFLAWRPVSYRDHFAASRFKDRDMAIAAYEAADPGVRDCLDMLAGTMTAMLEAASTAMRAGLPDAAAQKLAHKTATALKPLIAHAGAVINGEADALAQPQAMVDRLLTQ
jgi:hypothetical protein